MNRNIEWTDHAWDEYLFWQTQDKKILKRINTLIKECQRMPFEGTGKPEPLKANLSGFWSRRDKYVYHIEQHSNIIISATLACYLL